MEVGRQMSHQVLAPQLPTIQGVLGLFVQDCLDRQLTQETIRRYESITDHFLLYLGEKGLSPVQVDKHILHDYIRKRRSENLDSKTIENELSAIAGFYEFLVF